MRKSYLPVIFPLLGMLLLILDTKTALSGAAEGITLCLQTAIPSLFPFFILSSMATVGLSGLRLRFLAPLGRLLRIPAGSEALWFVGLIGGYPVGAKSIADANCAKRLSDQNSWRMLAFCSNAGPAFLFGIGSRLFSDTLTCWLVWAIHIAASIIVAVLTPGGDNHSVCSGEKSALPVTDALHGAIKTMAMVCGWVVIFRVILAFCQRWFLWALPKWANILILGMLELTNGCCALYAIEEESLRFVFFAFFLGFGGVCVAMQTYSVCRGLDIGMYLPGKLTQSLISGLLAGMLISREIGMVLQLAVALILVCAGYYFLNRKSQKRLDFFRAILYNKKKLHTR